MYLIIHFVIFNLICNVKFSSSQIKKGKTETSEINFYNIFYIY